MPRSWTDQEKALALKAAQQLDRSWSAIKQEVFADSSRTVGAIRKQVESLEANGVTAQGLDVNESDIEAQLNGASAVKEDGDEEGAVTEDADLRLNEDELNYFYLPAGMEWAGERLDEGTYFWQIRGEYYTCPESTWDAICGDYSEMGGNLTQKECARKYGIRYGILRLMLRRAGQFKASLPFSERTVLQAGSEEDFEDLEDAAIEIKERRLEERIRRRHVKHMKSRLRELEREQRTREEFLAGIAEVAPQIDVPSVPKIQLPSDDEADDWQGHLPTTDEHVGKLAWDDELWGENYDTDIGCQRLRAIGDAQAQWIAGQPGRCGVAYRTFVGDLVHALFGQTENDTRLDQDTRPAKVWAMLTESLIYSVNVLRPVTDLVVVMGAKGNHDGTVEFFQAMHLLKKLFEGEDDVHVVASPRRYNAFHVGETLHVLDHGKNVTRLTGWKAKAQADSTARETGQRAFAVESMSEEECYRHSNYIYTYYGHLHEREVSMQGAHHELRRLPAVCESDDYENSLRFHNHPVAEMYRLDDLGRLDTFKRCHVDQL